MSTFSVKFDVQVEVETGDTGHAPSFCPSHVHIHNLGKQTGSPGAPNYPVIGWLSGWIGPRCIYNLTELPPGSNRLICQTP